jgi:PAS domain S-box-containing protein
MLGDVRDEWKGYYDRAFAGERFSFVIKSTVNSEDSWREYFLYPIHNDKHEIIGISVFSRDVTDKKSAEQKLAHERALFNALMQNIPDAIYFKDLESKFIRVSDSIVKAFGAEEESEVIGKSDFDFFGEDHARPAYEGEQEIIKTGNAITGKIEKEVRKNGTTTWAETFKMPLVNEDGDIIGTFGMSKDITSAKNNEIDLVRRTSLLRGLIENTPDSIFTIDPEYNLILANEKVKSLFEKAGVNIAIGDKVPGAGKWKSYYDRALSGESFCVEDNELNVTGDNNETYLHILGPVKDTEGNIVGASVISRNREEELISDKEK